MLNHEKEDIGTLSKWTKKVPCNSKSCIKRIKPRMKIIYSFIFDTLVMRKETIQLESNYIISI